jgi:hypothetical protein
MAIPHPSREDGLDGLMRMRQTECTLNRLPFFHPPGLLSSPARTLFLALLIGAGLWAWTTLRFETELIPILPGSLPSVRGLQDFSTLAMGEDEVYVVPDPELPEGRRAEILAKIRPALAGVANVGRVEFPSEELSKNGGVFAAWLLANAPPETFQKVQAALEARNAEGRLAEIPEKLAGAVDPAELETLRIDPLGLLELLGSGSQQSSGFEIPQPSFLVVSPANPLPDTAADSVFVDALQERLREILPPGERDWVLLTGTPVFNTEISRQMRGDILFMVAVASVLLGASFYAFYRTLRPLGWILFFQMLAMLSGLVAARLLFGGLNVISMGFASILLGVGMDYCILVYHHIASPDRDNRGVWRTLRRGIWFSAAVTASAFFMLSLSSFPGLRQLAVLVGFGLLMTALLATWLLPVVLRANPPQAPSAIFLASRYSASWILRRHRFLIVSIVLLVAGLIVARPWQKIGQIYDSSMENLRPVGSRAFQGQEWLARLDPSASDAIYILRASTHDEIRKALPAFARAANPQNPAELGWSIPSETHRAANLTGWGEGTKSRLSAVFEEAGFGVEWSGTTLRMVEALEAAARGDQTAFQSINRLLRGMAGRDEEGAFALVRLPGLAKKPVPEGGWPAEIQNLEIRPVSWVSLTQEVSDLAGKDFFRIGFAMLAAIVLLCAMAQKSAGLLVLNLLALVLAFCLFVSLLLVTGAVLTPLSLISVPLLIGLAIDYSLHILMALEHERGDLHRTYDHLAAPVVLTGLSASIGFGVPILTNQPALQNFGLVMDLGVVSSVVACLVFLPCIYRLCRPARRN